MLSASAFETIQILFCSVYCCYFVPIRFLYFKSVPRESAEENIGNPQQLEATQRIVERGDGVVEGGLVNTHCRGTLRLYE